MSSKEIWKRIPDYPGYEISSRGKVRTYMKATGYGGGQVISDTPQRISKQYEDRDGYMRISLSNQSVRRQFFVHRLMAKVFLGDAPIGKPLVCHRDGNPSHNVVSNLRYDDQIGNFSDELKHGTRVWGEKHSRSILTEKDVIYIRKVYASGKVSARSLGEKYKVGYSAILSVTSGKTWKYAGGPITHRGHNW